MASNLKRSLGAGIGHSMWFTVIGSNRPKAAVEISRMRTFARGLKWPAETQTKLLSTAKNLTPTPITSASPASEATTCG
jgi:hypothetical protein